MEQQNTKQDLFSNICKEKTEPESYWTLLEQSYIYVTEQ